MSSNFIILELWRILYCRAQSQPETLAYHSLRIWRPAHCTTNDKVILDSSWKIAFFSSPNVLLFVLRCALPYRHIHLTYSLGGTLRYLICISVCSLWWIQRRLIKIERENSRSIPMIFHQNSSRNVSMRVHRSFARSMVNCVAIFPI